MRFIIYLIGFEASRSVLHSSLYSSVSSHRQLSVLPSLPFNTPPHPHPPTPPPQANFRPPKGQRSRVATTAREKRAHTTLSHTHTHAHTAPFCRCRSTCTPPAPIFRNTKRRSQLQPHFHCAFSSYHRYWRIYLIVHTTRLYLFKHTIVNYTSSTTSSVTQFITRLVYRTNEVFALALKR